MLSALLPPDLAARFRGTLNSCWVWEGNRLQSGYGRIARGVVHRLVYEHFCGPIPNGLEIDHQCRNRPCGHPMHLDVVTPEENDLRRRDQTATCRWGHPWTEATTYRHPNGSRVCRVCKRER